MIQENEIRIGNYFQHDCAWSYRNDIPGDVFNFRWEASDWYALGECTMDLEFINPVPLTEEILFKCGYTKSDLESGKILVVGESFDNVLGYVIRPLSSSIVIKSVHQLQNLYFPLKGEELKFAEPFRG